MRAVPTIKPKHFDGLTTMVHGGLHYTAILTIEDWIAAAPFMGGSFTSGETKLQKLAAKRRPGRIELNPSSICTAKIVALCDASQRKQRKKDNFNVAYGLSESFARQWAVDTDYRKWNLWRKSEGQSLVLVAFDDADKFVGYSSFKASCSAPIERDDKYSVRFELMMVYVLPERRKLGFGLDLSIATGTVCHDILRAYYLAIPAGSCLVPHIYADYESQGGQAITEHVSGELDVAVDMLRQQRPRPEISLCHTELDAGY